MTASSRNLLAKVAWAESEDSPWCSTPGVSSELPPLSAGGDNAVELFGMVGCIVGTTLAPVSGVAEGM